MNNTQILPSINLPYIIIWVNIQRTKQGDISEATHLWHEKHIKMLVELKSYFIHFQNKNNLCVKRHLWHPKIFREESCNIIKYLRLKWPFKKKSIYSLHLIFLTEILITQWQGKSLSIEEELAMAMGFQQPSIQNTSYNTIQGKGWSVKNTVD